MSTETIKQKILGYDEFIDSLRIGMKVESLLSSENVSSKVDIYTGEIYYIIKHRKGLTVDIVRDDGMEGGGRDDTWNTIVTEDNYKYIKILQTDWDE